MNELIMIPLLVSFFSCGLLVGIFIDSRLEKTTPERVERVRPELEDK